MPLSDADCARVLNSIREAVIESTDIDLIVAFERIMVDDESPRLKLTTFVELFEHRVELMQEDQIAESLEKINALSSDGFRFKGVELELSETGAQVLNIKPYTNVAELTRYEDPAIGRELLEGLRLIRKRLRMEMEIDEPRIDGPDGPPMGGRYR